MDIKVLGTGCYKCVELELLLVKVLDLTREMVNDQLARHARLAGEM